MATRVYLVAGLMSAVTAAGVSLAIVRWVRPPAGPSAAAPAGGNDTTGFNAYSAAPAGC